MVSEKLYRNTLSCVGKAPTLASVYMRKKLTSIFRANNSSTCFDCLGLTEFTRRRANFLFRSHVNGSPSFVRKCRNVGSDMRVTLLPEKNFLNIYGALHLLFEKTVKASNWGLSDFILLCFFLFLLELLMTYNGQLPFAAAKL